jgi:hypothetical protein
MLAQAIEEKSRHAVDQEVPSAPLPVRDTYHRRPVPDVAVAVSVGVGVGADVVTGGLVVTVGAGVAVVLVGAGLTVTVGDVVVGAGDVGAAVVGAAVVGTGLGVGFGLRVCRAATATVVSADMSSTTSEPFERSARPTLIRSAQAGSRGVTKSAVAQPAD